MGLAGGVRLDRSAGFRMADCLVGALPWHGGAPAPVGRRTAIHPRRHRGVRHLERPVFAGARETAAVGVCLRETPDRSDLVVLPVLAAEVSRPGTRHSRHRADSVFDDRLHRGRLRLGHRRLHVVGAHQARVDGERRAQNDHGYLCGDRSVGDHREPDAKRVARRWPDRRRHRVPSSLVREPVHPLVRHVPATRGGNRRRDCGGRGRNWRHSDRRVRRTGPAARSELLSTDVRRLRRHLSCRVGRHSPARAPTGARHVGDVVMKVETSVIGTGAPTADLTVTDMRPIVDEALRGIAPGARVLAVVSDRTRDDNTPELFPLVSQVLARIGAASLDVLIAQGTHVPMNDKDKRAKIGAGLAAMPLLGTIFDHHWDRESELTTLGTSDADVIAQHTGGLLRESVKIRLNAHLAPGQYDVVLVLGATVPHEVAGFAGGAKYFFPGVAGPELTHLTHWLGALATIERVIGRIETPTRHVIEAAADFVTTPVIGFTSVSTRDEQGLHTHALFTGGLRETVRQAAAVSSQVHIRYTNRRYRRVVAILDAHYDEMWVGGKASYKLGGIIEDGGELIVYAPHLKGISTTHGALIEKYGYAPLEVVSEEVEGSDELRANLCVAAHLAHVSYAGRVSADGRVEPRYRITLASAIPEEVCRRVKLGFADWGSIDLAAARRDPDTLVVDHAGRDLFLLERTT